MLPIGGIAWTQERLMRQKKIFNLGYWLGHVRVLPIIAYTERLRPIGVSFSGFR